MLTLSPSVIMSSLFITPNQHTKSSRKYKISDIHRKTALTRRKAFYDDEHAAETGR